MHNNDNEHTSVIHIYKTPLAIVIYRLAVTRNVEGKRSRGSLQDLASTSSLAAAAANARVRCLISPGNFIRSAVRYQCRRL